MTAGTPALSLKKLQKSYGDRVALGPVDLDLKSGQQVAVVGANGSGKTTMLRITSGLLDASEGEVFVNGEEAGSLNARAALAYMPDEPVLYDDLSVREHIQYLCPLVGSPDWAEEWMDLAQRLNIAHRVDDLPSGFSRGLRQKTSILLTFMRPFDVLLVDEPFVGLDEPGRRVLVELLAEAANQGKTVLIASHQLDLLDRCTRCVALAEGKITYDGHPKDADLKKLVSN